MFNTNKTKEQFLLTCYNYVLISAINSQLGQQVTTLPQFFDTDEVFFIYGNERHTQEDFELDFEESKAIQQYKKTSCHSNG